MLFSVDHVDTSVRKLQDIIIGYSEYILSFLRSCKKATYIQVKTVPQ